MGARCCVDPEQGSAGRLVTSLERALGARRAAEQVRAVPACSGSSGGIAAASPGFPLLLARIARRCGSLVGMAYSVRERLRAARRTRGAPGTWCGASLLLAHGAWCSKRHGDRAHGGACGRHTVVGRNECLVCLRLRGC